MIAFKYKHEIVAEYGFDRKTLYNKLKKCGVVVGRGLLGPTEQKAIYDCLGYPPVYASHLTLPPISRK